MAVDLNAGSIVPIIAVVLSLCRAFAPVKDVWRARKEQQLNELNPFPFAAAILNCAGWVVYTTIKGNVYVFLSDAPGATNSSVDYTMKAQFVPGAYLQSCVSHTTLANAVISLQGTQQRLE